MSRLRALSSWPIRRLSLLLIVGVSVATLLLSSGLQLWFEARSVREALQGELHSLTTLLANRSTAALAFDDPATARENLDALQGLPHVMRGCLYDEQGRLFAHFARSGTAACPPWLRGYTLLPGDVLLTEVAVKMEAQRQGLLRIEASLEPLYRRLWQQLQLQLLTVALAAGLALLLASRLQGLISRPLRALSAVAREMVSRGDYRARAEAEGPAELQQLALAFNQLMQTVAEQQASLESSRCAALEQLAWAQATPAALSGLARSPGAAAADVPALMHAMLLALPGLLPGCCYRLGVQFASGAGGVRLGQLMHSARGAPEPDSTQPAWDSPAVHAGLQWHRAGTGRCLAVSLCAEDPRLDALTRRALDEAEVGAFLWASAGAANSDTLAFVCIERRLGGAGEVWPAEAAGLACELSDLLALVAHDASRRQAEATLRDREAYNELLFQGSCMPLALLDPQSGQFVDANAAALAAFGVPDLPSLRLLRPEQLAAPEQLGPRGFAAQFSRLLAAARSGARPVVEMDLQRLDGSRWTAEVHGDRIDTALGSWVQLSLIDISSRLQAQRAAEQLNAELEARVARRTAALSEANGRLSTALDTLEHAKDELVRHERLASLGALVAGVAHELNTPIGNSLVVASTLQDRSQALQQEVQAGRIRRSALDDYLQLAAQSGQLLQHSLQRAAELVARFKQMAEDPGKEPCQLFDLNIQVAKTVQALQAPFAATPHRLVFEAGPPLLLNSRPLALEQVLSQLIMNTLIHAHGPDKPGLTRVRVLRGEGEPGARVEVEDDGAGIAAQHLPRIFDPFFTTRLGSGGNGLGLHTVFRLVTQALGGRVGVRSQPGLGSCFTLTLPQQLPQGLDAAVDGARAQ